MGHACVIIVGHSNLRPLKVDMGNTCVCVEEVSAVRVHRERIY